MGAIVGGIDLKGKGRVTRSFLEAALGRTARSRLPGEALRLEGDGGLAVRVQSHAPGPEPTCHAAAEDGSLFVVLDGEISNRSDVLQNLRSTGQGLQTRSDAEVILRLFQIKHDYCALDLRGSFAFAVFEPKRGRLVVARDHLGTRSLKFFEEDGLILFASEARSLISHEAVGGRLDIPALGHYLTFGFLPAPFTGLSRVSKVPPGHVLVADRSGANLVRYWRPRIEPDMALKDTDALGRLEDTLRKALQRNLGDLTGAGLLLDGTPGATALAWALVNLVGMKPPALEVIPPGSNHAANRPAWRLAETLGLEYRPVLVEPAPTHRLIQVAEALDEPLADPAAVNAFEAFSCLKDHVQATILADGVEALLGGGRRYHRDVSDLGPGFLPRGVFRAFSRLWPRGLPFGKTFTLHAQRPSTRFLMRDQIFREDEKLVLLGHQGGALFTGRPSLQLFRFWFRGTDHLSRPERYRLADMISRLPDSILARIDQCAHAHGVETKLPLLDPDGVGAMGTLPADLKATPRPTNHLLHRLTGSDLPASAWPGSPEYAPPTIWARGDLKGFARQVLTDPVARQRGLLTPAGVDQVLGENGKRGALRQHTLVMLELWCRSLEGAAVE